MDPILERLIDVGGAFLIVSLVVEKIADFLKLHTEGLSVRAKDPGAEKQREKGILSRNILIGIILAFFLKADAIQMLVSGAADEVIGWENVLFFAPDRVNELTSIATSPLSGEWTRDSGKSCSNGCKC